MDGVFVEGHKAAVLTAFLWTTGAGLGDLRDNRIDAGEDGEND
jgi:hypothetical protein